MTTNPRKSIKSALPPSNPYLKNAIMNRAATLKRGEQSHPIMGSSNLVLRASMQSSQALVMNCWEHVFKSHLKFFKTSQHHRLNLALKIFAFSPLLLSIAAIVCSFFSAGCPSLLPEIQGFEVEDQPVAHFNNFLYTYSWPPLSVCPENLIPVLEVKYNNDNNATVPPYSEMPVPFIGCLLI